MIALLIVSVNLPARQSDRTQPISIKADRSTFDERSGQQTLSGNVQITQGTMRISADFIAVSLEDNALSLIEGRGSPIQFQQENESGELIRGEAQEVVYNAQSNTLILQGNAKLSQPNQQLSSDRITFDANTQKVDAQGGTDNGRVSIQIQPPKSQ